MRTLALLLFAVVLAGLRLDLFHGFGPRGTDGQYYYAQARSLCIDGDLDLDRELRSLTPRPENIHTSTERPWDEPTATGRVPCKYALGAPLLQLPFLALGQGAALGLAALGFEVRTDGYGLACYLGWRFGLWTWTAVLLLLAALLVRRVTGLGGEAAGLPVAAALLCGPLLYFTTGDPYSAHLHSAAVVAVALWLALEPGRLPLRLRSWAPLLLGLACGLALCVRSTNLCWALAAVVLWLCGGRDRRRPLPLALCAAGGLAGFAPQLLAWWYVYGSVVTNPYEGEGFALTAPWLAANLWGLRSGLFTWNPGWLPALAAVPVLFLGRLRAGRRVEARELGVLILALLALLWLVASWWCWWWGDGFGGRAASSAFALVAIGFAALRRWMPPGPRSTLVLVLLVALCCLWTFDRIRSMEELLPAERAEGQGFPTWMR